MLQKLIETLQFLNINYHSYEHEPLFTCEDANKVYDAWAQFTRCKNLFLKDDKKRVWLLIAQDITSIKLRPFSKVIDAPGLRFVDEQMLMDYLGVKPGSVTPFGLLNDKNHKLTVIIDKAIIDSQQAGFHPLKNTATLVISPTDLLKFIEHCGNEYLIHDFNNQAENQDTI